MKNYIKTWLRAIFNEWHTQVHSNSDLMKVVEANKKIDDLQREKYVLGEENKRLKLALEVKDMNDFLEGR